MPCKPFVAKEFHHVSERLAPLVEAPRAPFRAAIPQIHGGGIDNTGTLTVSNCTFTGNSADRGGAIANFSGVLTLSNCTLANNTARTSGGGISNVVNFGPATTTVRDSTISGNSAVSGGGIFNRGTAA